MEKEECVFHQVHLVLHSTGDILREIHTLCFRGARTKGLPQVNPSHKHQQSQVHYQPRNTTINSLQVLKMMIYFWIYSPSLRLGYNFHIQMCCFRNKKHIQCKVREGQIITRHMLKNVSANTAQHTINCTHSNARNDNATNVCQTKTHSKKTTKSARGWVNG